MQPSRPLRAITVAALVLGGALGASACGGDDGESEADIKEQLSETLQRSGDAFGDQETADCFADIVIDEVGIEELQDLELSAEEPPKELEVKIADAALRAQEECGKAAGNG
jgi:hypothetical protein